MTPTVGAFVVDSRRENTNHFGSVVQTKGEKARIRWKDGITWEDISDLRNGLRVDMVVLHIPIRNHMRSYGLGVVQKLQSTAGYELVLVEFQETNERVWLPWQYLRKVKDVSHRFMLRDHDDGDGSERLRLRMLAWAMQLWNENTGALSQFEIDPLPHQIHLVHHILNSQNYNWLIADDVGLGKTIEMGLLLSAMRQRKHANRVLLITPSGLTQQWKEEMDSKFGINDFHIYGTDFSISDTRNWKIYDYVIGSMDLFKQENHFELLAKADEWDLIIVDEAHRLSRRQFGNKYEANQRYKLLKMLRGKTDSIVLLTATPHQGKEDSFVGLLELIRPEFKQELLTLSLNPEIISEMVFRNYKADVTDIDGNFIFQGKTTSQIPVPTNQDFRKFDIDLQSYLKKGYRAESDTGGNKGRAIGFVMTVYRKLSSSSIAAIHLALSRRLERLEGSESDQNGNNEDYRYQGEFEELKALDTSVSQFFEGEKELLETLIDRAAVIMEADIKIESFLNEVVDKVLQKNSSEKILIFSEYRATQNWIKSNLNKRFGEGRAELIHGGMNIDQRREAIYNFENNKNVLFLISTEAGGEGINLQENCHVMVNYDLPWNPMRLVQRVGRLYRYGQEKRVVVFNLVQADTADEHILSILYQRIDQVVSDMSVVEKHEFNDAVRDDILGSIAEMVDIETILEEATQTGIQRTQERIDDAIKRAKEAAGKQRDLFKYASGFDGNELQSELKIDSRHLQAFSEGMCRIIGIEIAEKRHEGMTWKIKLPDDEREILNLQRSTYEITFDKKMASKQPRLELMHIDNWLFKHWITVATHYQFRGTCALVNNIPGGAIFAAICRWQNENGRRMKQELAVFDVRNNAVRSNIEWLSGWLLQPQTVTNIDFPSREAARDMFKEAERAVLQSIREQATAHKLPEAHQWVVAAASDKTAL